MRVEQERDFRRQAEELVDQMTVEEMASQLRYDAPPIPRLGIPAYNWWNEALHGVARAGTATVFPQAIGLAAMFDEELLGQIADAIATEGRAKYNEQSAYGDRGIYKGLTFWSPNINIFRDPRWGRGHETYGEDPYLTSRLGVAFIKGMQGSGRYRKAAACAKHFAVHSGPEKERHSFDARATAKDMEETYLPAFRAAVQEAGVEAVMGAYNRTNGEPCCGSETLLKKILREQWGFKGHVVSDCWAIRDFHENHKVTATAAESAALALRNGCDVNCGNTYLYILKALGAGLVTEEQIRESAVRLFTTRVRLGLFDPECEFNRIPYEENDSPAHRSLCLEAARRSAVLLKNDGLLPLDMSKLRTIGVIGPTADLRTVLEGNYFGTASEYVTNLEGIREAAREFAAAGRGSGAAGRDGAVGWESAADPDRAAAAAPAPRILYSQGSHLWKEKVEGLGLPDDRLSEAVTVARHSDVVILCVGLDASLEGEEKDTGNAADSGDKTSLLLPECQRHLIEAVCAAGTPVVLVLNAGSAIDLSYAQEHCGAILQCWYSGGQGGRALADILFGKTNPSGRLPVTFYYEGTLPDFRDYHMKGRTYRYMSGEPLYPFGYGLSYTTFQYADLRVETERPEPCQVVQPQSEPQSQQERPDPTRPEPCQPQPGLAQSQLAPPWSQPPYPPFIRGSVRLTNTGARDGAEVVQIYIDRQPEEKVTNGRNERFRAALDPQDQPRYSLCWFKRLQVAAGESQTVPFHIPPSALETVLEDGSRAVLAGTYTLYVGGSQPDSRSRQLMGRENWCRAEIFVGPAAERRQDGD